jgi:hypothetical protein
MNLRKRTSGSKSLNERAEYHDPRAEEDSPSSTKLIIHVGNKRQSTDGTKIVRGGDDT